MKLKIERNTPLVRDLPRGTMFKVKDFSDTMIKMQSRWEFKEDPTDLCRTGTEAMSLDTFMLSRLGSHTRVTEVIGMASFEA